MLDDGHIAALDRLAQAERELHRITAALAQAEERVRVSRAALAWYRDDDGRRRP